MTKFKFCPKCRAKFANKKIHGHTRQVCSSCKFVFYQNPKPTVGVFIVEGSKVLLAKRGIKPYKGWWDSVGGFMEEGESPQETAAREAKEETGLDIELMQILGVTNDKYLDQYLVSTAFLAKIANGAPRPSDDVVELKWFPLDKLPAKISFEANKKALSLLKRKFSIT